jgi:glycosyltransferase involved in cell wall biosynthesis
MNVMEIVSGIEINGARSHCAALARELARCGHTVTVVARPDPWLRLQIGTAPVAIVESNLRRWPLGELRRIAALARAQKIEVLHTHMSGAHVFGVALRWLSGIPCVATAHAHRRNWHWRFNDRVIAVSKRTRSFHIAHNFISPDRIDTVYNFVDHARFAAAPASAKASVRASFGIDNSAPLIGFVGRLHPSKGWSDLLDVLVGVRTKVPDIRLLAVGAGADDYRAELERKAARLGIARKVIWAGERSEVPELLGALDLFVSPSRDESFGLAVLEAMAAGVPVVAAAVGGLPEVVRHRETGLLVTPGDRAAMADAIVSLLRDPNLRRSLGERGRCFATTRFSAERQVPLVEAALARAIDGHARVALSG